MKDLKFNFERQVIKPLKHRTQSSIRRRIRSVQHSVQNIVNLSLKRLQLALTILKFLIILLIGFIIGVYFLAIQGKDKNSQYFQAGIYILGFTGIVIFLLWISSIALWQTTISVIQKDIQILLHKESEDKIIQWKFIVNSFSIQMQLSHEAMRVKEEQMTLATTGLDSGANLHTIGRILSQEKVQDNISIQKQVSIKEMKTHFDNDNAEEDNEQDEDIESQSQSIKSEEQRKSQIKLISPASFKDNKEIIVLIDESSMQMNESKVTLNDKNIELFEVKATLPTQKKQIEMQNIQKKELENNEDDDMLYQDSDDEESKASNLPSLQPKQLQNTKSTPSNDTQSKNAPSQNSDQNHSRSNSKQEVQSLTSNQQGNPEIPLILFQENNSNEKSPSGNSQDEEKSSCIQNLSVNGGDQISETNQNILHE